MRATTLAGLFAAAVSTPGCAQTHGPAGPAVQRSYRVDAFDRIEVAGPYDVEVRTGAAPTVQAKGRQRALERMVVEVRDGQLRIRTQKQRGLSWSINADKVALVVTMPSLAGATIAGSGVIRADRVRGKSFEGSVAGSGEIAIGSLQVDALKLAIAGSGGTKAAGGRVNSAALDVAGSGSIDTRAVRAESAKVVIAGSGNVAAQATGTASVSIMGSGDVEIIGGAKCSVSKQGSGDVRCS